MKAQKIQIGILGALICVIWVECILFGGLGLGVVVGSIATYIGFALLCKAKGIPLKLIFFSYNFIAVSALTLCFALYDNLLLKSTNIIGLMLLIGLHMQVVFNLIDEEKYSARWLGESVKNNVRMPFCRQKDVSNEVKSMVQNIERENLGTIKQVIKGIMIAIPIMFIVTTILVFADAAFESTCEIILSKVNFDELMNRTLRFIVWGVIFFCLMSSYHFCIVKKVKKPEIEEDISIVEAKKIRYWSVVSTFTVVIAIASVYCIYICSQFNYFIGAFGGTLPDTYTCAMYARRGFFELIPIIIFNGLIVGAMGTKLELTSSKKQKMFRVLSSFYCIFTGFLITTAIAKMYLYMNLYGLTIKRLYVTWFLVVCFVFLICIFIKVYRTTFKLVKFLFVFFVAAYVGLNYANLEKVAEVWNEDHRFDKPINKWGGDYYIDEDERKWYDWNLTYEIEKAKERTHE